MVATLIIGGRLAVPRALRRIAELRNREIFTLSVVFIGLGAAYVTSAFGMSLALGAFLAGLIISESDYGLQARLLTGFWREEGAAWDWINRIVYLPKSPSSVPAPR